MTIQPVYSSGERERKTAVRDLQASNGCNVVPPTDLVNQFMLYTKGIRTSPLYRKWGGIAMVSGAMERRIHSTNSSYTNYPHLYVMLAGPPGSGKNIIETVARLWRSTTDSLGAPAFYVGADNATKAALIDRLSRATQIHVESQYKYNCLLLPVEEFSEFFSVYDPSILSFFTKIYNVLDKYTEDRRGHGTTEIKNPLITFIVGYQPDVMNKVLLKEGSDQGFLRRTILIFNEYAEKNSIFDSPSLDLSIMEQICHRLHEISLIKGEMQWEQDAKTRLQRWEDNDGVETPRPIHPHLQYYNATRLPLLIKLSMIASMSESTNMSIHLSHVERAIEWLLEAEAVMPQVFENMREGNSDYDTMQGLYAYALVLMNTGHIITDALLLRWLSKKVPSNKYLPILNSMQAIGSFTRKPDSTWRVTGKSPRS